MPRLLLTAVFAAALTGCDAVGDIVIVPEFDLSYSFESGLDMWFGNGVDLTDPAVNWSVEPSSEASSSGSGSAKLFLENLNGQGKIWLERVFEVEPERTYDIDIEFDFGTADFGDANLWRIVAGAHTASPETSAELMIHDATGNGSPTDAGVQWLEKSYRVRATSDEEGEIRVVIGVWGTWETPRSYFVDNVRLLFTRG